MKKHYNLKKSVMWNCCFFSSVAFRTFSHSLIQFSFSNKFFFCTFSLSFWKSNRHVCQRSPRKKKKKKKNSGIWAYSTHCLYLLPFEKLVFIHQIVFWNSFCLALSNHGFQFFIGWHFRYFWVIYSWNKILIIVNA